MSFTIDDFKVYPFEKDKFYIVLCDPRNVSFQELAGSDWISKPGPEVIFLPCEDPTKSTIQLTFDSIEAVKDWIKELENAKTHQDGK